METSVILVFIASALASGYLWILIYRSNEPRAMKILLGIAVAIPVIGPLFWPFLSMPPRKHPSQISGFLFRGPTGPWPKHPRWAAISYRVLIGLIAMAVVFGHLWVLQVIGGRN